MVKAVKFIDYAGNCQVKFVSILHNLLALRAVQLLASETNISQCLDFVILRLSLRASLKHDNFYYLYIIDGVSVCLFVCPSQNSQFRPKGPSWCQLKAGTLACAGRRLAYMLVVIKP